MQGYNMTYVGKTGRVKDFTKNIPGLGEACKIWTLGSLCKIVTVSDDGFYVTVALNEPSSINGNIVGYLTTDIGVFPMEYIRCHISYFELDNSQEMNV